MDLYGAATYSGVKVQAFDPKTIESYSNVNGVQFVTVIAVRKLLESHCLDSQYVGFSQPEGAFR